MTARRARPARAFLAMVVGVLGLALAGPGAGPVVRAADPAVPDPAAAEPAAAQPAPGDAPRVVWHGPRTERVVALTFDDGYRPATVRRIFQVLRREKVPATFFVNGVYMQRAPDLWRRIAAAGYPIGSHSYLHRDMTTLTPRDIARDLARTRKAVEDATGRPMLPFFRPPYGARNAGTDRAVAAAGFPVVVMWDVVGADTGRNPTVGGVVASAVRGRPGSIVLLHAGPKVTPRALPAIIARYRERGFRFVTVPELLGEQQAATPEVPAAARPDAELADAAPELADAAPRPAGDAPAAPAPAAPAPAAPAAAPSPPAVAATPAAPVSVVPAAPAAPSPGPRPAAREAAWARQDDTRLAIAGGTAVGLLLLVLAAAAAGRSRAREGDGPG